MEIKPKKKNLLITGASGYLGGRLFQFFSQSENWNVIVAHRKSKGNSNLKKKNIRLIDWDNVQSLKEACSEVFAVIHLAGMNAQDSTQNPSDSYKVNTLNTALLIEASIQEKVKKFIYFSTAHVYASPLIGDFCEDSPTVNFHPYPASHKAAEDIARYYASLGRIDSYVIRLSNAYGPPFTKDSNCWSLLVNDLCKQAVEEKKMKVRSNGLQKRDFVPIVDILSAVNLFLIDNSSPDSNKIFNVGGDWAITVWEMAQTIQSRCEALLGFRPVLERIEAEVAGNKIEYLRFNIDRLKKLGFQSTANKLEEIDNLLRFCKAHFSFEKKS
ncbi:NAD-dependent epimerase/dehydratase family protein [Leptospira adleri]|uniref:NAD-dependent epimerase/dehydratase family protein n=1 Tax=Leptospira adleri TaxID=2023186 RepID=UPI00108490ED|nr:SDR family oxidoreductase [Leptospira adleri]TGM56514.1 SDR family oxidoreductase [Leptospira adleri]